MPDKSPIGIVPMVPNRLLRCPHSGRSLLPAPTEVLARLEAAAMAGTAVDATGNRVRNGTVVAAFMDTAGEWLYPLDGPTPRMLPEEAIRVPVVEACVPVVEACVPMNESNGVPAGEGSGNFPTAGEPSAASGLDESGGSGKP